MEGLRERTAKNLYYQGILTLATAGTSVFSVFILAHVLSPAEFGRAMFAFMIVTAAEVISDFGVMAAFLARREEVGASVDAAATLRLCMSAGAAGGLLALSFVMSGPLVGLGIAELLVPLALVPILSGLGFGSQLHLRLDLDFKRLSMAQAGGMIGAPMAQATLALFGFGVWAIVYGALVGYALTFVLLQVARPALFHPEFNFTAFRRLLRFGRNVLGASVLLDATNLACASIVRAFAGADPLGAYLLAMRVATLVPGRATAVVSEVLLPTLSKMAQSGGDLVAAQLSAIRALALPLAAANLAGIALAAPGVALLGNPQWAVAVPAIQWLALWGVLQGLTAIGNPFLFVKGRPVITLHQMGMVLALTIAVGTPAAMFGGLTGFLVAQLAVGGASFVFIVWNVHRLGGPGMAAYARASGPSMVTCALAGAVSYAAWQPFALPLLAVVAGVAAFAAVAVAVDHFAFRSLNRQLVREFRRAALARQP